MEDDSFYENLPSGPDSDSDFPSEEEVEPEGYEEPIEEWPQNTNKNTRLLNAPSTISNHLINNQENIEFNDLEPPEAYEEPYELLPDASEGGASGSPFVRSPISIRGPSVPPPLLMGLNLGIREPSFPRPSLFNPSLGGNIRHRQTSPVQIGFRPRQINPRPFQLPSRFGNVRPPSSNFGSPKFIPLGSNVGSINRPQRYPSLNTNFLHSSSRPSFLPINRQQRPIGNNSNSQVLPRIQSGSIPPVISQTWKKSNKNAQNSLSLTPPKNQSNAHVRTPYLPQHTIQNSNIRQATPWSLAQNAPPLAKSSDTSQERPSFIRPHLEGEELLNSQNPNKAPPLPIVPKPLSSKNFSSISSKQDKPGINISVENLQLSMGNLQLDSGAKIPMTEIYKSLLNEDYFHPISKESAYKYMTDGTFLLRPSTTHTENKPLTMILRYNGKNFTFSIEKRKSGLYSIGNEKDGEMAFSTVQELISFYHDNPFHFEGHRTYLLHPATKPSM